MAELHVAKSELLHIVKIQEQQAKTVADAKEQVAYLRDVHLALLLQEVDTNVVHSFFSVLLLVDHGASELHIILHGHKLANGWIGRLELNSTICKQHTTVSASATECKAGSIFQYPLPPVYDEWAGQFILEFRPEYLVPEYLRVPTTACIAEIHVDILDAIISCDSAEQTPSKPLPPAYPINAQLCSIPCVCEIWLKQAYQLFRHTSLFGSFPSNCSGSDDLAAGILPILLFEHMADYDSDRVSRIMTGTYTAEFGISSKAGSVESVTIMCVPTGDGSILLRIRSADRLAYSAIVFSLIRRLKLLLLLCLDGKKPFFDQATTPVTGLDALNSLEQLQEKCMAAVAELLQHRSGNTLLDTTDHSENIDCAAVECGLIQQTS